MNRISRFIEKNGLFTGLLALIIGVPIISSAYTQNNVFLIKTVFFQTIVFALFIVWLAKKFLARESLPSTPLRIPMLSFLAIGLLSFLISPFGYAVLEEFLRFLSFFLLYTLMVEEVAVGRRRYLAMEFVVLAALIVCSYGILQRLGHPLINWVPGGASRVMSFFGNPNFFGTHLVAIIPLLLALSIGSFKWKKLFATTALAAALACLIFTETRGAWIGFAFSLLFFSILAVKTRITGFNFKTVIPLFGVLFLALILLFLSQDVILERISQIRDSHGSLLARIHIWEVTSDMIKASPIFGSGLGTFQIVFPRFKYPGFDNDVIFGNLLHAHNEYLEIWAEMGLLGLATFLWLMVAFFSHVLKNLKQRPDGILALGLVSGIAGVLVDSLFSTSLRWTGPAFTFWLLFSLAVVMVMPKKASPEKGDIKPRGKLVRFVVVGITLVCIVLIAKWHLDRYLVNVHVGKALAFLDVDSKTQAISEFRKAQAKDPQALVAIYMLGCLKIEEGDFHEAKRWFEKLETLAPDFANSHEWKGYLFFRLGNLHQAEKEFKICTYVRGSVFNHNMLGRIYSLQEKWDQAIEEFEESCRLGTKASEPIVDGSVSFPSGESAERPIGNEAGPATPAFGWFEEDEITNAHIMLGKVYYEKKEYSKSVEHLKEAEEDRLSDTQKNRVARLYNNIAWDYVREMKKLAEAKDLCQRALDLNPSRPELIHDTKAWIYFKTGDLEQAKRELETALSTAPENETIKEHLLIIERALKGELRDLDMQEIRQR